MLYSELSKFAFGGSFTLVSPPTLCIQPAVVEDNPETGIFYVGRGCYPNREGVVQLDAALMRGRDCSVGAVAGLER